MSQIGRGRKAQWVVIAGALGVSFFFAWSLAARAAALPEPHQLEVESYQRDFGVSAQKAEQNLETQERGAGIVDQLKAAQGNRYAGVWFDNEAGEFVIPAIEAKEKRSVTDVYDDTGLEGVYRFAPAQSTWAELENAQERLDKILLPLIEKGLAQTSLDPRTNAVVIDEAEGTSKAQHSQIAGLAAGEGVKVEIRPAPVAHFEAETFACSYTIAVCDKPLRGGVFIEPAGPPIEPSCTTGFKAIGNAAGNRFMLTAGHCYKDSADWASRDSSNYEHYVGHIEAGVFPGADYAAIRVNGYGNWWEEGLSSWPSQVVYWGGNQNIPINSESWSYLGQSVCHSGWVGKSNCGTVTALNKTVSYGYEGTVYNLSEVSGPTFFATHGDSGGPIWAGNTALGLLSGGSTTQGNLAYYSEITEDTTALGVTVGPRIGSPPPPPPPTWHSDNLGGSLSSDPDASSWGVNNLNVFARGVEGGIWRDSWNGAGWSNWLGNWGCCIVGSPSAVSWGNGRIDVVARVSDNSVGHWYSSDFGTNWAYDNLGGTIEGDPDIASLGSGKLEVFVRGKADNAIYHRDWNGSWGAWQGSGCCIISSPGAVSWKNNRLDVVGRVAGDSIGHWYSGNGGASWGYDNLGGTLKGDPDISSWGENRLDVFATGTDSGLWHKWWEGGWSAWQPLGGSINGGPGAVSWGPNRIDVFGRNLSNNSIEHLWWG